jgi:L-asparaginase II
MYKPLYELTRGEVVESVHFGAMAVVDSHGNLIAQYGDPYAVSYLRSSAKPFQAIPFAESGGPEAFNLSLQELALICASHSGTDAHVQVARALQEKIGLHETDLLCGSHPPYHKPTERAMVARGEEPSPIRHNCSGKHTGMLAFAHWKGWPKIDYISLDHPVQRLILDTFSEMCSLPRDRIFIGIDGCSAPNFAAPLYNVALAYARLADPAQLSDQRAAACRNITRAMQTHPEMVGGPGRLDTRLMEVGQGRLVAKGGAEGYQGIGLLPGTLAPMSPGVGVAIKISDGDPKNRARSGAAVEVLRQLDVLTRDEQVALADFGPILPVNNWRNLKVGVAQPCFSLER